MTESSLLKKAEILSQHITGVQNEFDLLLSVDSLSSSVKTLPQTSKGQDNDGGNDDDDDGGGGDDDKDRNGSRRCDNGSGADDDEGVGSDEGCRDDKSDDCAVSESGGNDDEGGEITWCQHFRRKIVTLTNKV